MPLLHSRLSVIVFWLTFTQLQLIGLLTGWLVDDLLTDLLTSLLTNLLTNWLADWFNYYWLADWLTDRLCGWWTAWLTGYNTCHKLLKQNLFFSYFLENFAHSLFSLLFSLKCAPLLPQCWATCILEHWDYCNTQINIGEEGKSHKCFKICDEYCSLLTNWLDWLANILRFMLRKGINFNAFMMWIKITAVADENDWFSFQIRFVQQMCQDFNSQDFKLIFSTVSAV